MDHDVAAAHPQQLPARPSPRPVAGLLAREHVGYVEAAAGGPPWLTVPAPTVTMIINLAGPFGGFDDGFVAGMESTAALVERAGGTACIDVKLTPLGAYRVLGLPMDELADRAVDVVDLLGRAGRGMLAQVRAAPDWSARFAAVDAVLASRAAAGAPPSPVVAWALEQLTASAGRVGVSDLAAQIGCSRRHLARTFRRQVGLPPKTVARILRFDHLRRRMRAAPHVALGQLAVECGYYDQAHLSRDVRDLTGEAPSTFFARHDTAAPGEVPSVQDAIVGGT